ncbi:serine hydrolase domain-containing protein [Corynebacterium heidelbergense]|uniref:Serine hydrolase n=1 Tax=Corynebacterium heidelbergense TaxID=2055947 RepID=A0A364V5L9_9CORY|nr:serine hydrolase domain-containing protein [Corynebacterium heidelbergense]RAV31918.1 serine hydrolase [Corynebacterium heidelbergense]
MSVQAQQAVLSQTGTWPVDNVSAAVVSEGDCETYGDANRVYPLASVSKLISTYAVLLAFEEGAFDLDQPVDSDLVEGFDCPPTVRQLLSHTSGVDFSSRIQHSPIGAKRVYSSSGFEILADVVARTTEIPFGEYVRLGICNPLGLNIALTGSAGHGFSSNLKSMVALVREFLSPTLLAAQTMQEALTVQNPELGGIVPGYGRQNPCPWGLGFEIHGAKQPHWLPAEMPPDVAGHFGQSGTFTWFHQRSGTAAVVLTDRPFGPWAKSRWAEFNAQLWRAANPDL